MCVKATKALTSVLCLIFLFCLTGTALAFTDVETGEGAAADTKMTAGLGTAIVPDYEGSDEYTGAPLLLFQAHFDNNMYIDLFGNRVRANVLPYKQFHFGPVLQYRAERDDVDNDTVDKMQKVDAAVELGGFAGVAIDGWIASLQIVADVSDAHDGVLYTLSAGYRFVPNKDLSLVPTLSSTYADEDYMQTYFGVDATNVGTSGLPLFDADSGVKDVSAILIVDYHPWEQWKLVGGVVYKKLLGDAEDSPLVDTIGEGNQFIIGVMGAYRF